MVPGRHGGAHHERPLARRLPVTARRRRPGSRPPHRQPGRRGHRRRCVAPRPPVAVLPAGGGRRRRRAGHSGSRAWKTAGSRPVTPRIPAAPGCRSGGATHRIRPRARGRAHAAVVSRRLRHVVADVGEALVEHVAGDVRCRASRRPPGRARRRAAPARIPGRCRTESASAARARAAAAGAGAMPIDGQPANRHEPAPRRTTLRNRSRNSGSSTNCAHDQQDQQRGRTTG